MPKLKKALVEIDFHDVFKKTGFRKGKLCNTEDAKMERITGNVDLSSIKRLQLPNLTIDIKCPRCGEEMDIPLIDQIYYPGDSREQHSVAFECDNCGEVEREIKIVSVIATLDVGESKII